MQVDAVCEYSLENTLQCGDWQSSLAYRTASSTLQDNAIIVWPSHLKKKQQRNKRNQQNRPNKLYEQKTNIILFLIPSL